MCLCELRNEALEFVKVAPAPLRGNFSAFKTFDEICTEINDDDTYCNRAKRRLLIDQIIAYLHGSYVYSDSVVQNSQYDPVLQLLAFGREIENENLQNWDFFRTLIKILGQFDDLHTYLELPYEISKYTGFVPFLIEPYFDHQSGKTKYIISHLAIGFVSDKLSKGDEVVRWQGLPIDKAIKQTSISSEYRQITQSMNRRSDALTLHSLNHSLPSKDLNVLELDILKDGKSEPTLYCHMYLYAELGITAMFAGESEIPETTIQMENAEPINQSMVPIFHQMSMAKTILFRNGI